MNKATSTWFYRKILVFAGVSGVAIALTCVAIFCLWNLRFFHSEIRCGNASALTLSADGHSAVYGFDGQIITCDLCENRRIGVLDNDHEYPLAIREIADKLIVVNRGSIKQFGPEDNGLPDVMLLPKEEVSNFNCQAALTWNGSRAAVGRMDGLVRIWDLPSKSLVFELDCGRDLFQPGVQDMLAGLSFYNEDKSLIVAASNRIVIYNLSSRRVVRQYSPSEVPTTGCVSEISITSNHSLVVCCARNTEVAILSLPDLQEVGRYRNERGARLAWLSPDSQLLLTAEMGAACKPGRIIIWDVPSKSILVEREVAPAPISDAAYLPDSSEIVLLDAAGGLKIHKVADLLGQEKMRGKQ